MSLIKKEVEASRHQSPVSLCILGVVMGFMAYANASDFFGDGTKGSILLGVFTGAFALLCLAMGIALLLPDSRKDKGRD
jgi:uncharacterized membrane protein